MEKKTTPKKSTSKKTQVKATTKTAPKKTTQVVKSQKTNQTKTAQALKTQKKTQTKNTQVVKSTKNQTRTKTAAKKQTQNANTGYLLGLASLVAWIVPVIGDIVTVSGIYCCYSGLKKKKGLATVGLFLNVLFLGLALINVNVDLALMM